MPEEKSQIMAGALGALFMSSVFDGEELEVPV